MPIYEYKCDNNHVFEVIQKITDEPLHECEECGAPASRVLHPVAVHFKGSGFYNTDYGKKKGGGNGASAEGGESKGSEKGSDPGSQGSKPDSGKSESKSESKPAASTAD